MLIDNGSGDDSVARFQHALSDVEIVPLPENIGFGRGNNVGLRLGMERGYRLALVINNDAFPHPDMLTHLLAAFEPSIGILTPKIYHDPERDRIWFFKGREERRTLNLRDTGYGVLDTGQAEYAVSGECDYIPGACMLVNLEALKAVGLFDERFFMYYEELDWSIRMRAAGYRLMAVATAHLYHRVSFSSGGSDSPLRLYHLSKSAFLFYRKHWRRGSLVLIVLYRLGNGCRILLRGITTGRFDLVNAYLKAVRDGLFLPMTSDR